MRRQVMVHCRVMPETASRWVQQLEPTRSLATAMLARKMSFRRRMWAFPAYFAFSAARMIFLSSTSRLNGLRCGHLRTVLNDYFVLSRSSGLTFSQGLDRLRETPAHRNRPDKLDADLVHIEVTREANGLRQPACRDSVSKTEAIFRVRQHTTKA